jgi:hypothetical protein
MPKHRRKNRGNSRSVPQRNPRGGRVWIILLPVAVIAALVYGVWKPRQTSTVSTVSEPAPAEATNVPPPAATEVSPDFLKLRGRWLRPDGGYVLEISNVMTDGELEAGYFNPRPINVSTARATREGDQTKVFIELRDVNYPGSTYTLTYVPQNDQLSGIYYQALLKQSFEVVFIRSN